MSKLIAYLQERLYVPKDQVMPYHLDEFTYDVPDFKYDFDSGGIKVDDYRTIRTYTLSSNGEYYAFHRGDITKLKRVFKGFKFVDRRACPPLPFSISLNSDFSYREGQEEALAVMLKPNIGGIIEARPAFGKTVFSVAYAIAQGTYTLFISDMGKTLSKQFEQTLRKFTNISDIEKDLGKKLIGPFKIGKPIHPFSFTTFQYVYANLDRVKKYRDAFGTMIIDECHTAGAKTFCCAISMFNPLYRVGLSATPTRKDKLHVIFPDLIGKVRHTAQKSEGTKMIILPTGIEVSNNYSNFTNILKLLSYDSSRNMIIAKEVEKYIALGHKVLVLTRFIDHTKQLSSLLKSEYDIRSHYICSENDYEEDSVKERIALKEGHVTDPDDKCLNCLVATSKKFGKGFDLPELSCLVVTIPIGQEENLVQYIGRIGRVGVPGKKSPVVVYLADAGHGMVTGCCGIVKRAAAKHNIPIEIDTSYSEESYKSVSATDLLGKWSNIRKNRG